MVRFENGVWLDSITGVDSLSAPFPKYQVVTHAHADHVRLHSNAEFFLTSATKDLVATRHKRSFHARVVDYGREVVLGENRLALEPAGHVLGSAQVVFDNGVRTVVTGDLRTTDSLLLKGAKPVSCDTLVIESTFGKSQYVFPPREAVFNELEKWVRARTEAATVVLAGYSVGKAQELTAFISRELGITPLVSPTIFAANEVYRQHGIKLGDYLKLDHNLDESRVMIVPPQLLSATLVQSLRQSLHRPVETAMATGWPRVNGISKTFPVSDHCDFNQLLAYVEATAPKRVFTYHGFSRELAGAIHRRLGIPAQSLETANQKLLMEFA